MGGIKKYRSLVFAVMFFTTQLLHAQNHNHGAEQDLENPEEEYPWLNRSKSKHGGELVSAGKYKLEVVPNAFSTDEKLCVYLVKGKKELSLNNASGEVELRFKDGRTEKKKMIVRQERLVLDSFEVAKPANITFRITVKGKEISGIYYYPGLK